MEFHQHQQKKYFDFLSEEKNSENIDKKQSQFPPPQPHHHHKHTSSTSTNKNANTKISRTNEKPYTISDDFERLFNNLHLEIQEYNNIIDSVQKFSTYIEHGRKEGIFDDQDMEWIEEDLKKLKTEKDKKEQEYKKRKEIYENSVVKLEAVLEKRKKTIEDADRNTGVFNARPDLLKKFAQKRAILMKIIETGKKEIQTSGFSK
jgi:hypothetical protein